jgi:hypothetical protein
MGATIRQHLVDLSSVSFPRPATPNACEDGLRRKPDFEDEAVRH